MTEKANYYAIIPIHQSSVVVEGKTMNEVNNGISDALRRPEISFPFYNFREGIILIKGRKIKLPPQKK